MEPNYLAQGMPRCQRQEATQATTPRHAFSSVLTDTTPRNRHDEGLALAVSPVSGELYVTGYSDISATAQPTA
jgi:hypothetical protein